jgi:hypothetical protein
MKKIYFYHVFYKDKVEMIGSFAVSAKDEKQANERAIDVARSNITVELIAEDTV